MVRANSTGIGALALHVGREFRLRTRPGGDDDA